MVIEPARATRSADPADLRLHGAAERAPRARARPQGGGEVRHHDARSFFLNRRTFKPSPDSAHAALAGPALHRDVEIGLRLRRPSTASPRTACWSSASRWWSDAPGPPGQPRALARLHPCAEPARTRATPGFREGSRHGHPAVRLSHGRPHARPIPAARSASRTSASTSCPASRSASSASTARASPRCCASWPARTRTSRARPGPPRASRVGYLAAGTRARRQPSTSAATSWRASPPRRALLDRYNEVAMKVAEDYTDELMEEMTSPPGPDRRRQPLGPRQPGRRRHGGAALPARRRRGRHPLRRREPPRRALQAAARGPRHAAPRRADQPPRRRDHRLAAEAPDRLPAAPS